MYVIGKNTIVGKLDLSSLQRLQEGSPMEREPFHITVKSGDIIEVNDLFCSLVSIQNAYHSGLIDILNIFDECDAERIAAIPGYDPTKKQVLANVNGTIMWKTAKDCTGADA
jgi:hypothetical protein